MRQTALQPETSPVCRLELLSGGRVAHVYELGGDYVTIGRTPDNDIPLESETVSRLHATLALRGGRWNVQDNGSKNGILVNGLPVREARLEPGDLIQVGACVVRYEEEWPATEAPEPAHWEGPWDRAHVLTPEAAERRRAALIALGVSCSAVLGGWLLLRDGGQRTRPTPAPKVAVREAPVEARPAEPSRAKKPVARFEDDQVVVREPRPEEIDSVREGDEEMSGTAVEGRSEPIAPEPSDPRPPKGRSRPMDEGQELATYLGDGLDLLRRGDFERAASAFHFALVLDPKNLTAMRGLKAAEYKKNGIEGISVDSIPDAVRSSSSPERRRSDREKRERAQNLLLKAEQALTKSRFAEAISFAEGAREVEVPGNSDYLNTAKQIIDRARMAQRESYEPFLVQAQEMYGNGSYAASRDLCQEMLRRDPSYMPARDCVTRAEAALGGGGGR